VENSIGVGVETADMPVQEVLSRSMRDRRAVARYAGLTGSPDESGRKRREKGLTHSGNAWVRRGMIQLAWRFLMFQKDRTLAQWFRARTENARGARKTMIVALAQATDRPAALRAGGRGTGWRLREIFQSSQFSTFPTVSAQSKFASASKSADAQ